jgi:hypothetical protein
MKALIDGDVITYRCGFSSQHNKHYVYSKGNHEDYLGSFDNKADLNMFIRNELKDEDINIVTLVEAEPIQNCLHSVKLQIEQILNDTNADEYQIYLTGGNQYREQIATIKPYKGNRDPDHKPVYYQEIKDYLINRWDAKVVDVIEADDAMSIAQHTANYTTTTMGCGWLTVICTNDKDLDMVPGLHYNFVDREFYVCDSFGDLSYNKKKNKLVGQGLKWFYAQLVMGDAIDNIEGIPGKGPAATFKLLNDKTTEWDLYQAVRNEYIKYVDKTWPEGEDKSNVEQDADMRLLETGRLLWMCRTEDDVWEPPKITISHD